VKTLALIADAATGMPGEGIPTPILLMILAAGILAVGFVLAAIFVSIRPSDKDKADKVDEQ